MTTFEVCRGRGSPQSSSRREIFRLLTGPKHWQAKATTEDEPTSAKISFNFSALDSLPAANYQRPLPEGSMAKAMCRGAALRGLGQRPGTTQARDPESRLESDFSVQGDGSQDPTRVPGFRVGRGRAVQNWEKTRSS